MKKVLLNEEMYYTPNFDYDQLKNRRKKFATKKILSWRGINFKKLSIWWSFVSSKTLSFYQGCGRYGTGCLLY